MMIDPLPEDKPEWQCRIPGCNMSIDYDAICRKHHQQVDASLLEALDSINERNP